MENIVYERIGISANELLLLLVDLEFVVADADDVAKLQRVEVLHATAGPQHDVAVAALIAYRQRTLHRIMLFPLHHREVHKIRFCNHSTNNILWQILQNSTI